MLDHIKVIAQDVRIWVECHAQQRGYNSEFLNGWCAIASAELYKRLAAAGYNSELHMHENEMWCHVFLVHDEHVVDVTATQFVELRNTPVYIAHIKEAMQYSFYDTARVFNSAAALRKYQKKAQWPVEQTAFA
jgi:hypothetical protein